MNCPRFLREASRPDTAGRLQRERRWSHRRSRVGDQIDDGDAPNAEVGFDVSRFNAVAPETIGFPDNHAEWIFLDLGFSFLQVADLLKASRKVGEQLVDGGAFLRIRRELGFIDIGTLQNQAVSGTEFAHNLNLLLHGAILFFAAGVTAVGNDVRARRQGTGRADQM